MKVRIIEHNNIFYPQKRILGVWFYFTEGYADSIVERNTKEKAQEYLNSIHQRIIRQRTPTNVVTQPYDI